MSIRKRESRKAKNGFVYAVYFPYKENGITKKHYKSGFKTKKEAQQYENEIKAKILKDGFLKKEINKTFKEVYQEFLEVGCSHYQPATIHSTKKCFPYFEKELGNILIKNIDYKTLQAFFNSRGDKGIETNKNIKKAISRVLNYGIKAGYIQTNISLLINVVGVENHMAHEKVLEAEDFNILISALEEKGKEKEKYKTYAMALKIAYYTGLRVSEVLTLHKEDIDFQKNVIKACTKLEYKGLRKESFYRSSRMKSKASKTDIPIAYVLKEDLIEWLECCYSEKVLCDSDYCYINPNILSNDVKRVAKEIGIDFHFHMLRHSYCTNLVMAGLEVKQVQELMRHSNINTTMTVYTHITEQHKQEAINKVFCRKSVEKVSNLPMN